MKLNQKFLFLPIIAVIMLSCSAVKDAVKTGFDLYDMDKSYLLNVNWLKSEIYSNYPFKPRNDKIGMEWYQYSYNDSNWNMAILPDKDWKCNNCDRYFRGYFEITAISDFSHDYAIDIQSDDGIWIYVNGKFLGHLGGEEHKEGCVNSSYCVKERKINPIQIDEYLIKGKNVIAVKVSESIGEELFNLKLYEISRSNKSKNK